MKKLDTKSVEKVTGGAAPVVIVAAAVGGAAVGYTAGYWANRD